MVRCIVRVIQFYQRNISVNMIPRCKYHPSCSQYTIDALEKYGVVRGVLMGIWRILRCNPFSKGGYDPVK